jgi:hypothetical protein
MTLIKYICKKEFSFFLFTGIFFFFFINISRSQDNKEIWLINGKTIKYSAILKYDTAFIYYKPEKGDKIKKVSRYKCFSIKDNNKKEEIVYLLDTTLTGYLTVDEMRSAVNGAQDGRKNFDKTRTTIIGMGAGVLSAAFLPITPILSPVPIMITTIGLNLFYPPVKWQPEHLQQKFKDEAYKLGYQNNTNDLKVKQTLKIGAITFGIVAIPIILFLK